MPRNGAVAILSSARPGGPLADLQSLGIQIFADGADLAGIEQMNAQPFIAGFTTNPTLMRKAGISDYRRIGEAVLAGDPKRAEMAGQAHVRRIAKEVADLPDEAFGLPGDEATDVESGA